MSPISFAKNRYHHFLAWFGNLYYRNPSKELTVIGITGTKGKSTTAELLHAVLTAAGYKVAALSSVHVKIAGQTEKNRTGNTMPGRMFIQKFLRQAADAGCTYAIIEVTSQGVVQHRHKFIQFDVAAMTCLHPEHIESHGSFENYREAKTSFFKYVDEKSAKPAKTFFINSDSPQSPFFEDAVSQGKVIWYGRKDVERLTQDKKIQISSWLLSDFNLENAALVSAIAQSVGIKQEVVDGVFREFKGVPGRLEFVTHPNKPLAVIDYAHTPESLRAVYVFLKTKGERLIGVIGSAGGGRDKWKRPQMAAIAEEFCDEVILTSDDPYDEDPKNIIEEMKKGMQHPEKAHIILDRKEAIHKAIHLAKTKDVVAITGMGSQEWFYGPKGKKIAWSERGIAEEALKAR